MTEKEKEFSLKIKDIVANEAEGCRFIKTKEPIGSLTHTPTGTVIKVWEKIPWLQQKMLKWLLGLEYKEFN